MTRVPAYYGPDGNGIREIITTGECPIGRTVCHNGCHYCYCYKGPRPGTVPGFGPVTVLCSAPAKKGKGTR